MSEKSTLFLDVDEILFKGSFGEAMWDSPVDIADDKNIKDWIRGLREDGGGGCVILVLHHGSFLLTPVSGIATSLSSGSSKRPPLQLSENNGLGLRLPILTFRPNWIKWM